MAQSCERLRAAVILRSAVDEQVFTGEEWAALAQRVHLLSPAPWTALEAAAQPALLAETEVLFTGWGCPRLDDNWLNAMPRLRAVFYAAGSIHGVVTPEFWSRRITISTSAAANAIPVAEFTLAAIILGLKQAFAHAEGQRRGDEWWRRRRTAGAYHTTVGLVGFGLVGRLVRERLRALDVSVMVADPTVSAESARRYDVTLVALETLFAQADAVSLHAPLLPGTRHLVRGHHFKALKPGAVLINTARGALVHEPEMAAALTARPDLQAVLDVTDPEPPTADSPLRSLPNVFLTPHLSGSIGGECRRMARLMIEEFDRYRSGEPLRHVMTAENVEGRA